MLRRSALAQRLVELTPGDLDRVFFSDSGSVAVEVAIKMALQYWRARGVEGRTRLLTIRRGYYGDTFQAMSVCDPVTGMHHLFFRGRAGAVFCRRAARAVRRKLGPVRHGPASRVGRAAS